MVRIKLSLLLWAFSCALMAASKVSRAEGVACMQGIIFLEGVLSDLTEESLEDVWVLPTFYEGFADDFVNIAIGGAGSKTGVLLKGSVYWSDDIVDHMLAQNRKPAYFPYLTYLAHRFVSFLPYIYSEDDFSEESKKNIQEAFLRYMKKAMTLFRQKKAETLLGSQELAAHRRDLFNTFIWSLHLARGGELWMKKGFIESFVDLCVDPKKCLAYEHFDVSRILKEQEQGMPFAYNYEAFFNKAKGLAHLLSRELLITGMLGIYELALLLGYGAWVSGVLLPCLAHQPGSWLYEGGLPTDDYLYKALNEVGQRVASMCKVSKSNFEFLKVGEQPKADHAEIYHKYGGSPCQKLLHMGMGFYGLADFDLSQDVRAECSSYRSTQPLRDVLRKMYLWEQRCNYVALRSVMYGASSPASSELQDMVFTLLCQRFCGGKNLLLSDSGLVEKIGISKVTLQKIRERPKLTSEQKTQMSEDIDMRISAIPDLTGLYIEDLVEDIVESVESVGDDNEVRACFFDFCEKGGSRRAETKKVNVGLLWLKEALLTYKNLKLEEVLKRFLEETIEDKRPFDSLRKRLYQACLDIRVVERNTMLIKNYLADKKTLPEAR